MKVVKSGQEESSTCMWPNDNSHSDRYTQSNNNSFLLATSTAAVFYYVLTTVEWLHQQQRYYNWGGAPHTLSIGLSIYCGRLGYLNMGNYGQLWWQVIFNEKLDWIYIGRFGVLVVGLPGLLVESRWKSLNGYTPQQVQPPDWTMNDGGMPDKLVAIPQGST